MTNTLKALIITVLGAAFLTTQVSAVSAGDRSPSDKNTFAKAKAQAWVGNKKQ